jgi:hypothetical protein
MADEDRGTGEGRITSDRETIETWTRDTEYAPVRHEGRLRFVRESDVGAEHDRLEYEELHDELDRGDMAVIAIGEGDERRFEVVDQTEAVERAALSDEEVEDALLEGETVTSEITETRVIEREIVETETIESEIVDSQVVDDEVVATQVLTRGCSNCEMVDDETIEADVDVTMSVTRELLEELTVESEVVDTDVTERDTVEADDVEATVDVEGVQRTLLQSDLLGGQRDRSVEREIIESEGIESEMLDEGVVHTTLYRRSVIDDEVAETRHVRANVVDSEVLESETVNSEIVDADVVEGESLAEITVIGVDESEVMDREQMAAEAEERWATEGAVTTGAEREAAGTTRETAVSTETTTADTTTTDETTMGETETAIGDVDRETTAADVTEADDETIRRYPHEDDRGKQVVDADGEEIGMVAKVSDDVLYVDPHPSLTDRLKARLDWGEVDEDAYPLTEDSIDAITDDEVRLRVDRSGEVGEGAGEERDEY